jgi:hypothetical protein
MAVASTIPQVPGRVSHFDPVAHFVPWDSVPVGRQRRALCGELVDDRTHRRAPTCPACQAILAEHARLLDLEQEA